MAENFCSRHPDRPARAVRGRTWMCRACARAAVPDVSLTPDGWRFARSSVLDPVGTPRVLEPVPEWRGPAELPLLDAVVDDLVSQENQETAEHEL
jgi:hypothetical protein